MVSNGDVLIAPTCRVAVSRIEALLHHEVGTHVVTHVNGAHQPLHVLASGLAGHDETQEGLAVLAEHLVGGLTPARLRQLAARVVAVHLMVDGVPFEDVHATLVSDGIPHRPGVHHRGAGLPRRRPHQGRRVPAGAAGARRPPGRRRRPRHPAAGQDAPDRRAARRRPAPTGPAAATRSSALATSTTPRRSERLAAPRRGAIARRADRRGRMKIGFVVNAVATEHPEYTTTRLALASSRRGPRHLAHRRGRLLPPPRRLGGRTRVGRQGQASTRTSAPTSRACRPTSAPPSRSRSTTSTCW